MLKPTDVAIYFFRKDPEQILFNRNLIERNGRTFYEGNARINKYLHLVQNIYIAMTGTPLMDVVFYAYDNGAVTLEVQENFIFLQNRAGATPVSFGSNVDDFLNKFYVAFLNADIDELIAISHQDSEWANKNAYHSKEKQVMDSLSMVETYKKQYAGIIFVLNRMTV
jgi:uncharacterized phage-associated protein